MHTLGLTQAAGGWASVWMTWPRFGGWVISTPHTHTRKRKEKKKMRECPFLESFQTNSRLIFTARLYLSLILHPSRAVCLLLGCLFLPQLVSSPINPLQLDGCEELWTLNVSEMRPFVVCNPRGCVSSNMLPLCMYEHLGKWRVRERSELSWTEVWWGGGHANSPQRLQHLSSWWCLRKDCRDV